MRPAFAEQMADVERRLVRQLMNGADTLATIAAAVAEPSAHRVGAIADDARTLRSGAGALHSELVVLAARQTPVASDLRLLLAMIELSHHAGLIGNQFTLIAEQLAEIDADTYSVEAGAVRLSEMSAAASGQLRKAVTAFHTRDLVAARELDADDDGLDQSNRAIFNVAARAIASPGERALAMRQVLIARCLERIGDNAVDIGEQAAFVLTAELREFSDASRPGRG